MVDLERDLIEKIKKGDHKAFALLFQKSYSPLCAFACDFLHKPEIAEEIVQDVFLKLWNSRAELNIKSSLRSYLYKMVQNQALNYIRNNSTLKTIKEEKFENWDFLETHQHKDAENSIMDKIVSDEAEAELKVALNQLPEQCRQIFTLCRFEGLSYAEIAELNQISVSTVKTQMGRAMDKLFDALKKYF